MSATGSYASGDKVLITDRDSENKGRFYIARISEDVTMQLGGSAYLRVEFMYDDRKVLGFEEVTLNVNRWDVERIVA